MNIIYHCYGGTHSSVTAAGIHLGSLSPGKVPSAAELLQLPLFDKRSDSCIGTIILAGCDRWNNQIYILGRGNKRKILQNIASGLFSALGVPSEQFLFVDVSTTVNFDMRVGGTLSRKMNFISWGRPLAARGTQRAYPGIAQIVERVLDSLENINNEGEIKGQLSKSLPGVCF